MGGGGGDVIGTLKRVVEDAWFEITVVRNMLVKQFPGELSMLYKYLLTLFFSEIGHNIARSGVQVCFPDATSLIVFGELDCVVADEAALHFMYDCKGSAGLKPCMLCTNVYNQKTTRDVVRLDRTKASVHHTCADPSLFVPATEGVMLAITNRLKTAAPILGVGAFAELEIRLGWKHSPHGVMYSPQVLPRVLPSKIVCFDYAHVLFVNGVFNINAGLFIGMLWRSPMPRNIVVDYVGQWQWPKSVSGSISPNGVFSAARLRSSLEAKTLKCTASEGISLLPVLANFACSLLTHADPTVQDHSRCFLGLALVASCVLRSQRSLMDRRLLVARLRQYMQHFKRLYGDDLMVPKFHQMMHLASFRWVRLPNCLVHERKHKAIKRFANEIRNTNCDWDKSVLRETTTLHIEHLANGPAHKFATDAMLIGSKQPDRKTLAAVLPLLGGFSPESIQTSPRARTNRFETVAVADVVLLNDCDVPNIAKVLFHVSVSDGGESMTLTGVQEFDILSSTPRHWKCMPTERNKVVCTSDIVCAAIYAGNAPMTVLRPFHATRSRDM